MAPWCPEAATQWRIIPNRAAKADPDQPTNELGFCFRAARGDAKAADSELEAVANGGSRKPEILLIPMSRTTA